MDAGVKIKKPVSGIAMGLISENKGRSAILSDILGDEDHLGDMDFKVTGTAMVLLPAGIWISRLTDFFWNSWNALAQAKAGRLHILGKIEETMSEPRKTWKPACSSIWDHDHCQRIYRCRDWPGGEVLQESEEKPVLQSL